MPSRVLNLNCYPGGIRPWVIIASGAAGFWMLANVEGQVQWLLGRFKNTSQGVPGHAAQERLAILAGVEINRTLRGARLSAGA